MCRKVVGWEEGKEGKGRKGRVISRHGRMGKVVRENFRWDEKKQVELNNIAGKCCVSR